MPGNRNTASRSSRLSSVHIDGRRRQVLAGLLTAYTATWIPWAIAQPVQSDEHGAFLALSVLLAGRQSLDRGLANRYYDALLDDDAGFPVAASSLLTLINQQRIDPAQLQEVLDGNGLSAQYVVVSGIGGWATDEPVAYMKTGRAEGKGQAAGPMAEAIDHSLQYLSDEDLKAIAVYLQSVPAIRLPGEQKPAYAWGQAYEDLASLRGTALPENLEQMTGAQLYDAECASCHQAQGEGVRGLPSLFHNSVGRLNTNNLVMVILEGITRAQGAQAGTVMPAYRETASQQPPRRRGTPIMPRYVNSRNRHLWKPSNLVREPGR